MSLAGKSQLLIFVQDTSGLPVVFSPLAFHSMPSDSAFVVVTDHEGKISFSEYFRNKNVRISIAVPFYENYTASHSLSDTTIIVLRADTKIFEDFILTAQYLPTSLKQAVHKVKVIDRKKIDQMGAQNLRDVLTNELNIRISQDNTLGSSLSIMGISGQNVKILIDGVPVVGRLNGNIDISQINLNDVERIEIIEGPLSVSYGTDALAGTINIITKKSQTRKLMLSKNNYYESNGNYNTFLSFGWSQKKNIFMLSGGRNFFDGWSDHDPDFDFSFTGNADSSRYQSWKPKEQYFAKAVYGRYFDDLKFSYTADFFRELIVNRGYPRLPYLVNAFDDYYLTERYNNMLSLTGFINERWYLNAYASSNYFRRTKNTYFKDLTNLSEQLTTNSGDQDTSIFHVFNSRAAISRTKRGAKMNYEIGYDINFEQAHGIRIEEGLKEIADLALFTSAEFKIKDEWILRPAFRYSYNTAYDAPLIPSFNIKYSPKKKSKENFFRNNFSVRASYARGFRAPGIKELYFYFVDINHNIVGNPLLKAEYSNNFQGSAVKIVEEKKWTIKTEISTFYNSIENLITLAQVNATEYSYVNIGKFSSIGFNSQADLMIKNVKLNVGFAYQGRANETDEMKFIYSPEARAGFSLEEKKNKLLIAIFYKYTGKLYGFYLNGDGEVVASFIDDYHTMDASISRKICKDKIKLSLGSKNIFNVRNINSQLAGGAHSTGTSSIWIGTGRTWFLRFAIDLQSKK